MNTLSDRQIDYRNELARKAIHLSSISIPIVYYHISQELALMILIPIFLGFLVMDLVNRHIKPLRAWYLKTFSSMLRTHELDETKHSFNGATYVTLGAVLAVWLYPKMIAIAAFAILIICDTAAALVGRKFGKTKIVGEKSLEGSLAFFVCAVMVILVVPKLSFTVGLIIAVTATLVELFPIKLFGYPLDDNLTITVIAGGVGYSAYLLFFPSELPLLGLF
jgi:dolichol kinase